MTNFLYGLDRCCLDKHVSWFLMNSRALGWENIHKLPYNVAVSNLRIGCQRLAYPQQSSIKYPMTRMFWRTYSVPVSLEESSSVQLEDHSSKDATELLEEVLAQPLGSDEVKLQFHFMVVLRRVGILKVRKLQHFFFLGKYSLS